MAFFQKFGEVKFTDKWKVSGSVYSLAKVQDALETSGLTRVQFTVPRGISTPTGQGIWPVVDIALVPTFATYYSLDSQDDAESAAKFQYYNPNTDEWITMTSSGMPDDDGAAGWMMVADVSSLVAESLVGQSYPWHIRVYWKSSSGNDVTEPLVLMYPVTPIINNSSPVLPAATSTSAGVVTLATSAQVSSGINTSSVITPHALTHAMVPFSSGIKASTISGLGTSVEILAHSRVALKVSNIASNGIEIDTNDYISAYGGGATLSMSSCELKASAASAVNVVASGMSVVMSGGSIVASAGSGGGGIAITSQGVFLRDDDIGASASLIAGYLFVNGHQVLTDADASSFAARTDIIPIVSSGGYITSSGVGTIVSSSTSDCLRSGANIDTFAPSNDAFFNIGAGDPTEMGTQDYAYLHMSGGVMAGGHATLSATYRAVVEGQGELYLSGGSVYLNGTPLGMLTIVNSSDTTVFFDSALSGGTAHVFTRPMTGIYIMGITSSTAEDTFIFTAGASPHIDLPASVGLVEGGVVESGMVNLSSGSSYIMAITQLKAVIVEYNQ
jgi:hypothetical protein